MSEARIFIHYEKLEEFQHGMWKITRGEERQNNALKAANLMRDSAKFQAAMQRAIDEWPNSCLHNLTAENSNRLAWLGHAGCLLGTGSPEENTRIGWHTLSIVERDEANRTAQVVLDKWISTSNSEEGRRAMQTKLLKCPVCNHPIANQQDYEKAIQHHLWGGHNVEVARSHIFAKKIAEKMITSEEIEEIRQMKLC